MANLCETQQVSKLFPTENTHHDTNQTDKVLVRFNKAQEIFPSVTRVLSILLTTPATSAM